MKHYSRYSLLHICDLTGSTDYMELNSKVVSVQFTRCAFDWFFGTLIRPIRLFFPEFYDYIAIHMDMTLTYLYGNSEIIPSSILFNHRCLETLPEQWTWLDTYVNHFGWKFTIFKFIRLLVHVQHTIKIFESRFSIKPATLCRWRTGDVLCPMRLSPNRAKVINIYRYVNVWVNSSFWSWSGYWWKSKCEHVQSTTGHGGMHLVRVYINSVRTAYGNHYRFNNQVQTITTHHRIWERTMTNSLTAKFNLVKCPRGLSH